MANTENYNSHSCLLDDLMDQHIIKCDIDFGSTLLADIPEDGHFNTKSSPSHNSDSGCSDMSEDIRSVSPLVNDHESPFLDFDPFECDSTEQALDSELEMYFASPVKTNEGKENMHTTVDVVSDQDIPITDESSDEEYLPTARTTRSAKVIHTPQFGRRNVNSTSVQSSIAIASKPVSNASAKPVMVPSSPAESSAFRTPAIKVVKVIKTPSTSKKDIDNSIMEALDERNKKNAVNAKMNREKKKAYIKSLEEEIDSLKMENFALKENTRKTENERSSLKREVEYLRSVLANDSALSGLLKNISHTKNVNLSSTYSRKRGADHDHDYPSSKKAKVGAGVCLHVDQGNVSLEFCSKCSSMANKTAEES